MGIYHISFAGHGLNIRYDSLKALEFLDFLLSGLSCESSAELSVELGVLRQEDSDTYTVSSKDSVLYRGQLGVQAAAVLYDAVIFNLLNSNESGVALHAAAVSYQGKLLIIPGESGSGKSSVVAWLTAHDFSYLTDELIFFRNEKMDYIVPFTRPICLKPGSADAFSFGIPEVAAHWLRDESGAIIPHELLNQAIPSQSQSPALILFPSYEQNRPTNIIEITGAQASTRLMGCCANARNLRGHGFREIVTLSRTLPAFQLTFSGFSGLETVVEGLVQTQRTSF